VLRRGSSSKKAGGKEDVTDKKAARLKAAEEKAAKKKEAKEKAAQEKAAKKKGPKVKVADEPVTETARKEAPRGVLVRRPKTSIYSVLLGISAAALAIGCLVLVLEIWTYGAPWTFPWNIPINLK
jgi:hypothetical protein